jgi:predicted O-methyltransferase YrrM
MKYYTKIWNDAFIRSVSELSNFNLCLEVGCFEGLTTNYIIDNLLNKDGKIICVDPLTNVYLNNDLKETDIEINNIDNFFEGQYERFTNNVREHIDSEKLILYRDMSFNVYEKLKELYFNSIDFIYIDGDHRPESVYLDGVNCLDLCKPNGYILFDDYNWRDTHKGIDRFLNEHGDKLMIMKLDYQLLVKKL